MECLAWVRWVPQVSLGGIPSVLGKRAPGGLSAEIVIWATRARFGPTLLGPSFFGVGTAKKWDGTNFFSGAHRAGKMPRGRKKSLCACWFLIDFVNFLPFLRHTNFFIFQAHKFVFATWLGGTATPR